MSIKSHSFRSLAIALGVTGILATTIQFNALSKPTPPTQEFSGIRARVFCVAKVKETPCAVGGIIVRRANDDVEITRRTTPNEGVIQVNLNAGDYLVVPIDGSEEYPIVNQTPKRVRVTNQGFTEIKIYYLDGSK